MKLKAYGLLAALVVLLAGTNVQASPIATLTLQAPPGVYPGVEGNLDFTYHPSPDDFFEAGINAFLPDGSPSEVMFMFGRKILDPNDLIAELFFGTRYLFTTVSDLGVSVGPCGSGDD